MTSINAFGANVLTNVYSFTGGVDGGFPWATLTRATDGNLYGTANYGGARSSVLGYGSVFQMGLDQSFTPLYTFENSDDGAHPGLGGLVEGIDGTFYGTTIDDGFYNRGEVFSIDASGFPFTLYDFGQNPNDGTGPWGGLVLARDGNFYGTTIAGGRNLLGTIFRITPDGSCANLFSFNGVDGARPYCRLAEGPDGALYGTTLLGGAGYQGLDGDGNPTGAGTIFRITTNGSFASLLSFTNNNGAEPVGGLVLGDDNALYGTTQLGGTNGYGTVFRINTNRTFQSLISFPGGAGGAYPTAALVLGSDLNLYGTTADTLFLNNNGGIVSTGSGTVFRMTTQGVLITLYTFVGTAQGVQAVAGLVQASDGTFYGATSGGGAYNQGTIFRLSVPMTAVFKAIRKEATGVTLTWAAVAGQSYQLQFANQLGTTYWTDLGNPILATNGTAFATDSATPSQRRFYRLITLP